MPKPSEGGSKVIGKAGPPLGHTALSSVLPQIYQEETTIHCLRRRHGNERQERSLELPASLVGRVCGGELWAVRWEPWFYSSFAINFLCGF